MLYVLTKEELDNLTKSDEVLNQRVAERLEVVRAELVKAFQQVAGAWAINVCKVCQTNMNLLSFDHHEFVKAIQSVPLKWPTIPSTNSATSLGPNKTQ